MPRHKILIEVNNKEKSLLLYEILGGKPNNKLLPSEQTLEQRVIRPAQKGMTCSYHATRMLANRIGKHPEVQNTEERKVERMLSAARKEMTISKLRDDACNLLLDFEDQFDKNNNKTNTAMAKEGVLLMNGTDIEKQEFLGAVVDFAAARTLQKDLKFRPFIQARRKNDMADASNKGLGHLGINFSEEIKQFQGHFRETMKSISRIDQSDEDYNLIMSNAMLNHLQLRFEKFIPLTWHPKVSTFEDFSALLKNHGPLRVGGLYGKEYYDSRSEKHFLPIGNAQLSIGKTVKLDAQFWKAEERLPLRDMIAHAVVAVGTYACGNAKLILFIDPDDVSAPDQPSKLYAMSYKTFCDYAAVSDCIGFIHSQRKIGYIYAAPPEPENPKLKMRY